MSNPYVDNAVQDVRRKAAYLASDFRDVAASLARAAEVLTAIAGDPENHLNYSTDPIDRDQLASIRSALFGNRATAAAHGAGDYAGWLADVARMEGAQVAIATAARIAELEAAE